MDIFEEKLEALKEYLEIKKADKKFFDGTEGIYSIGTIEKLREIRSINAPVFTQVFLSGDECQGYLYEVECSQCKKIFQKHASKSKFLSHICLSPASKRNYLKSCNECKNEEKEYRAQREYEDVEKLTQEYIDMYLDPNKVWNKIKNYLKMSQLQDYRINFETVKEYILEMDYQEFLQTPYWKAIAEKKKIQSGYQCQMCSSQERLAVHHPSYDVHGSELQNLKYLTVVCNDCHERFHDIVV